MLDQARDRLPGRLAAGDALRLPVGTGTVAAVVMIHVLHLVADVGAALAEAARVLRPGGTLVAGATPEEDPPGDVYEEVGRVSRRFGGPRPQAGVSAALAAATAAGFTLTDRAAEPVIPLTPRNAAGMLESRSLSWIWSLDEEMWAREISPVLTRLRALPDQDRARFAPGPAVLAFTHP
jgi:SAM-dependent methyltransferase